MSRYTGPARIRVRGDQKAGAAYVGLARTILGEQMAIHVDAYDSVRGKASQSTASKEYQPKPTEQIRRRVSLPNGVTIEAQYNTYMPYIDIYVPPDTKKTVTVPLQWPEYVTLEMKPESGSIVRNGAIVEGDPNQIFESNAVAAWASLGATDKFYTRSGERRPFEIRTSVGSASVKWNRPRVYPVPGGMPFEAPTVSGNFSGGLQHWYSSDTVVHARWLNHTGPFATCSLGYNQPQSCWKWGESPNNPYSFLYSPLSPHLTYYDWYSRTAGILRVVRDFVSSRSVQKLVMSVYVEAEAQWYYTYRTYRALAPGYLWTGLNDAAYPAQQVMLQLHGLDNGMESVLNYYRSTGGPRTVLLTYKYYEPDNPDDLVNTTWTKVDTDYSQVYTLSHNEGFVMYYEAADEWTLIDVPAHEAELYADGYYKRAIG